MSGRIELRDVEVEIGGEIIIPRVSLKLEGPSLVTVIGPNGSGKTTLFRTIMGLIKPVRGRVLVNGRDVTGNPETAGRHIGYVPQLSAFNSEFPITARELVESSLSLRLKPPRLRTPPEIRRAAAEALEAVGASDYADKPISRLSGGQLQRVLIARALVWDPPILLLDEPVSAIDPAGKMEVIELIAKLSTRKLVVVASHDPGVYARHSKLIVVVNRGVRLAGPPSEVLDPRKLAEVYGDSVILVEKCVHLVDSHAA